MAASIDNVSRPLRANRENVPVDIINNVYVVMFIVTLLAMCKSHINKK